MNNYYIPPLRIDPRTLPPLLLTSEPGSFARNTLAVRIPRIIQETLTLNRFPVPISQAVQELHTEVLYGRIRALVEDTPDRDFWNTVSHEYRGRSWLDVPWYWAEAFFYRRMLEATRYFQSGPSMHLDPYRVSKESELVLEAAPAKVAAVLNSLPAELDERFNGLFHASLWGNRVDLSYNVATLFAHAGSQADERANLLVDHSRRVWEFLQPGPRRLALIEDNAGTETLVDLALIDFLFTHNLAEKISLHLKPQPFFVSDAMPQDVDAGMNALAHGGTELQALAERLGHYLAQGRLEWYTHWFYPTSLFYFQMPDELQQKLQTAELVIVKGDANYRRLLGDAHWDSTTPFDYVTRYFPTPVVALRTFKSEEIVGLPPGEAERLSGIDPDWLVNGRRGVIQARF